MNNECYGIDVGYEVFNARSIDRCLLLFWMAPITVGNKQQKYY